MVRATWLLAFVLIACGFLMSGCKPKEGANTSDSTTSNTANTTASGDSEADQIAANLAKLSTEDRAIAEKQKICPVSGAKLGGDMGVPVKVSVKGRDVFLCCAGCKGEIESDPDKYLAKLSQ